MEPVRGVARGGASVLAHVPSWLSLVVAVAAGTGLVVVVLLRARAAIEASLPPGPSLRPVRSASVPAPAARRRAAPSVAAAPLAAPDREPTLLETMSSVVCEPLADALCGARSACACVVREASCRDEVFAACTVEMDEALGGAPPDALREGLLELDTPAISRCLAEARAVSTWCDASASVHCDELVRSPVEIGQACTLDGVPCRGGHCDGTGTCRADSGEGARPVTACARGLVWLSSTSGSRCVRPRSLGEDCRGASCETGLRCHRGRCAPLARAGQPCAWDESCDIGHRCEGRRCVAGPTWCSSHDECGRGESCIGEAEERCVPTRSRSTETCADGFDCGRGRTCAMILSGRCEPHVCELRELVSLVGSMEGEPLSSLLEPPDE